MTNTTAARTASVVTAAMVRAYFQGSPERLAVLSPEAQKTVREGARGRLHPQAVKAFNSKRKAHRRYTLGNTTVATSTRKAQRADLMARGLTGARGPLSKAAKAALKG